jgi:hypothetical protein
MNTKVDAAQVIRVSRVFEETRKETRLSLTFTYPMWIVETDVPGRDNNFSVFCKLKSAAFMRKISRIEENPLIIFSELGFSPNSEKIVSHDSPKSEKASVGWCGCMLHVIPSPTPT